MYLKKETNSIKNDYGLNYYYIFYRLLIKYKI